MKIYVYPYPIYGQKNHDRQKKIQEHTVCTKSKMAFERIIDKKKPKKKLTGLRKLGFKNEELGFFESTTNT